MSADAPEPEIVAVHTEDQPTDSHVLANMEPEAYGAAQLHHEQTEVKDLGWNEPASDVPNPLVGGLTNEELWVLVRRFNKVSDFITICYVLAIVSVKV
jgi:hypothetical protein